MAIAVAYAVRVSSSASAVKLAKAIVPGTGVIAAVGGSIRGALASVQVPFFSSCASPKSMRQPNSTTLVKRTGGCRVESSGTSDRAFSCADSNEQDHGNFWRESIDL